MKEKKSFREYLVARIDELNKSLAEAYPDEVAEHKTAISELERALLEFDKGIQAVVKLNKEANEYFSAYYDNHRDKLAEYWRGQAKGTFDAITTLASDSKQSSTEVRERSRTS